MESFLLLFDRIASNHTASCKYRILKKSANEHLGNCIKKIIENDVERFKKDSELLEMKELKVFNLYFSQQTQGGDSESTLK